MTKSKFRRGVSLREELPNSIAYTIECACGLDDHRVIMEMAYEKPKDWPIPDFQLRFYRNLSLYYTSGDWALMSIFEYVPHGNKISAWIEDNWNGLVVVMDNISRYWWRLKNAAKLLLTGCIEVDSEILITDGEHMENFVEAVNEGFEHIKNARDSEGKENE